MWKLKPDELKSEINHEFLVVTLVIHWNKLPEEVADTSDFFQSWKDLFLENEVWDQSCGKGKW